MKTVLKVYLSEANAQNEQFQHTELHLRVRFWQQSIWFCHDACFMQLWIWPVGHQVLCSWFYTYLATFFIVLLTCTLYNAINCHFCFLIFFLLSFAHIAKFYYQQTSVGSTRDIHNKYLVVVTPFNDKVIYSIIDYREYTQWSLGWNAPKHCAYVIYFEYFFVNRIQRMKITSYVTHTIRLWDEMSELWRHWSFRKHDPFLLTLIWFEQNYQNCIFL